MQPQPIANAAPFVADVTGYAEIAPPRAVPLPGLTIRRLGPDDRAALAAHLIGLPREDRRTRFGGNTSDATIRRHCDDLDLEDTVCFAALDATGNVIGAALGFTYVGEDDHPRRCAEIAVSIAAEHRRLGLGTDLVARVCEAVAARGVAVAMFEFDPSNGAIVGLIRNLGGLIAPLAESCVVPLSTLH